MSRVYAGGVWDLFHYGHLRLLQRAKALAGLNGHLIVGVISDGGAKRYPVIPYRQRAAIIRALSCVDEVVEQPVHDATAVLRSLSPRPDILIHGDDAEPAAAAWFRAQGGRVILLPYTPEVSSSWLRQTIASRGTPT